MEKQGNIKIASENMMPIIKKWLYSEKDIFLREIVANAVDAITKHQKLVGLGEAAAEEHYRVDVRTDEKAGTLTVEDNGVGMTEEEVEKYITQIAFSCIGNPTATALTPSATAKSPRAAPRSSCTLRPRRRSS